MALRIARHPAQLAATARFDAAGSCVRGRGGKNCAPCPFGSVSAGGKAAVCAPCAAGDFTDAGQTRCFSECRAPRLLLA
jgi:hypothetical protein